MIIVPNFLFTSQKEREDEVEKDKIDIKCDLLISFCTTVKERIVSLIREKEHYQDFNQTVLTFSQKYKIKTCCSSIHLMNY